MNTDHKWEKDKSFKGYAQIKYHCQTCKCTRIVNENKPSVYMSGYIFLPGSPKCVDLKNETII